MEIWIKKNANNAIQLPINPADFEIECSMNNSQVTINSLGEITLIGKKNLNTIDITSFFPAQEYEFLQYTQGLLKPYEYAEKIESWMNGTVQLVITGTNINMTSTIESFKFGESDRTGDVAFTASFKKYIQITYKQPASTSTQSKTSKTVVKTNSKAKTVKTSNYTVKKGDTLSAIAKKKTGKASNWRAIYNQNKTVIEKAAKKHGKNSSSTGKWIYPGTKLVIKI